MHNTCLEKEQVNSLYNFLETPVSEFEMKLYTLPKIYSLYVYTTMHEVILV